MNRNIFFGVLMIDSFTKILETKTHKSYEENFDCRTAHEKN